MFGSMTESTRAVAVAMIAFQQITHYARALQMGCYRRIYGCQHELRFSAGSRRRWALKQI